MRRTGGRRRQEEGIVDIPKNQLTCNHDLSLSFKVLVAWNTIEEDIYIPDHRKSWDIAGCEFPV